MPGISDIALRAVNARKAGAAAITMGRGQSAQTFDLETGGYCARFVRQCVEVAFGLKPFTWAGCAPNARGMEENLKKIAVQIPVSERRPSDIVCMNKTGGKHGHIGICIDTSTIAENTSSGQRGDPRRPGTKLTRWHAIEHKVSGVYRLTPPDNNRAGTATTQAQEVKVVEKTTGKVVAKVEQAIAELLVDFTLAANGDHRQDQGKLYVTRRRFA